MMDTIYFMLKVFCIFKKLTVHKSIYILPVHKLEQYEIILFFEIRRITLVFSYLIRLYRTVGNDPLYLEFLHCYNTTRLLLNY